MADNRRYDEAWARRAIAARAKGERVLALVAEADDEGEYVGETVDALREALDIVGEFLDAEARRAELQSPTWRLLHRERDLVAFCSDLGQTASLPAAVAVAVARGENLAWTTNVEDGVVAFDLDDGTEGSAPVSLLRSLAPIRWAGTRTRGEVER